MKVLIWLCCIFVVSGITVILKYAGILLGFIPTFILGFLMFWTARKLCKKWDDHKQKKQTAIKEALSKEETLPENMQNSVTNEAPIIKRKSSVKKKIIRIVLVIVIICAVCFGGALVYIAYDDYQHELQLKMDSYDFTTSADNYAEFTEGSYASILTSTTNEKFYDLFYFEDNYYVNVFMKENNADIYDSGIYEVNGNTLTTENENGEITKYIIGSDWNDCYIILEDSFFDGDTPKADKFDATFTFDYSNNNFAQITFSNDGTYMLKQDSDVYNGKYHRDGYIVEGSSDDVLGSYKWLVYDGKITRNFYKSNVENHITDRLKYEFYKYWYNKGVLTSNYDRILYNRYVTEYEKKHPISLGE